MTKIINIGAASVSTLALDLEGNSQKIIGCLREAGEKGADIVLFPELCLTGYGAEDQFFVTGWIKKSEEYIKKFSEHVPEGMLVSVGFPLLISGGQVFNAAGHARHDGGDEHSADGDKISSYDPTIVNALEPHDQYCGKEHSVAPQGSV